MASIFMGKETDGLDRIAAFFYDGIYIRYAMIVGRRAVVFDTYGNIIYVEYGTALPQGFIPRSMQALRSRQTGKLVLGIGGFMEGSDKQRGAVLATDYVLQE